MERYILNYLRNTISDERYKKCIENLKVELDWHFYAYGENLSDRYKRGYKGSLRDRVAACVQDFLSVSRLPDVNDKQNILTFTRLPVKELERLDVNFFSTIFSPIGKRNIIGNHDMKLFRDYMNKVFNEMTFNKSLKTEVLDSIIYHEDKLLENYRDSNLRGLFLNTDEYYFNKVHIDIFKKLNRPSFIFSHGLPGIYSEEVDNSSDYLVVWGQQIKDNYISAGFSPDKIIVGGNPKYNDFKIKKLRNEMSDILVMTSGSIQWHMHSWSDLPIYDRSLIILYLYSVENVLKRSGVTHARLRPHPSVSIEWLSKYIDLSFYEFDQMSLLDSLSRSTLVIGCTSTTFLESLMVGVNYIIYEPSFNGYTMTGGTLVPPFDGSDEDVVIAEDEETLYELIKDRYCSNTRMLEKYMEPFNFSNVKNILDRSY